MRSAAGRQFFIIQHMFRTWLAAPSNGSRRPLEPIGIINALTPFSTEQSQSCSANFESSIWGYRSSATRIAFSVPGLHRQAASQTRSLEGRSRSQLPSGHSSAIAGTIDNPQPFTQGPNCGQEREFCRDDDMGCDLETKQVLPRLASRDPE